MARRRKKNMQSRQQQKASSQKQALIIEQAQPNQAAKETAPSKTTPQQPIETQEPAVPRRPYERLEKLLGTVNTASNAARSSWVGFLGIQAYIFVTIAGVSHTSLLLNSNVKLPVINTQLPLSSFFLFAPLVFLFAHFGFLLPHAMLTRKADTLNKELKHLEKDYPKGDYHPYRNEIVSYFFAQAMVGPSPSLLYGVILHLMGWLSFVFFPLFLLLFFQIKFLPFHDAMTTWFHRFYILADMIILFLVYKISLNYVAPEKHQNYLSLSRIAKRLYSYFKIHILARTHKDYYTIDDDLLKVKDYYRNVSWKKALKTTALYLPRLFMRTIGKINLFFIALTFLFFSIGIATFPGECLPWWSSEKNGIRQCQFSHESWLASLWGIAIPPKNHQRYNSVEKANLIYYRKRTMFVPTSWFFEKNHQYWFSLDRNLNLVNKDFISNKSFPLSKNSEEPAISLRGRDFRHAILDGSDLHFVDFSGADLSYASLEQADLRKTWFKNSILQNTNLESAKMQNAQLSKAILQGAYLGKVQLQNANLKNANLIGVYLGSGKLSGANLKGAFLQGAYLGAAYLEGTDLSEANLQGAKMSNAKAQGANFSYANLQAVDLKKARLQGASLTFSALQGANLLNSFLQGADLSQASLQYSQNLASGPIKAMQLEGTQIWFLSAPDKDQIAQLSKQVSLSGIRLQKDSHSYKNDIIALKTHIEQDPSLKERLKTTIEKLATLASHKENEKWETSKDYLFWKSLLAKNQNKSPEKKSQKHYISSLAKLACQDSSEELWVIRALINRFQKENNRLNPVCFLKEIRNKSCHAGVKLQKLWPKQLESFQENILSTNEELKCGL